MPDARIAVVVPEYRTAAAPGGGVATVADFFMRNINATSGLTADLISVTTSSRDTNSRLLKEPAGWLRPLSPRTDILEDGGSVTRFGAHFPELETRRYRPRAALTQYLNTFDLIQVVAGSPAITHVVADITPPVCLQVASMVKWERGHHVVRGWSPRDRWRSYMTSRVEALDDSAFAIPAATFVMNEQMYAEGNRRGAARLQLCTPGVDTDFYVPDRHTRPNAKPFVLSVGRFDDQRKNLPLLLKSFARFIAMTSSHHRLILAGQKAPMAADMRLAEQLGIGDRVDVRIGVSQEQLRTLYQQAACFMLTSYEEGLGLVVVEAMACGLPVVATQTAGTDFTLSGHGAGRLVEQGDKASQDIASALADVTGDQALRKRMGSHGRLVATTRFSDTSRWQVSQDIYFELLDRPTVA